jgi:hypothetical protein
VRQKRAWLLRELLASGEATTTELLDSLNSAERAAGRESLSSEDLTVILKALASEGFITPGTASSSAATPLLSTNATTSSATPDTDIWRIGE